MDYLTPSQMSLFADILTYGHGSIRTVSDGRRTILFRETHSYCPRVGEIFIVHGDPLPDTSVVSPLGMVGTYRAIRSDASPEVGDYQVYRRTA